jgi:hypothetical protein
MEIVKKIIPQDKTVSTLSCENLNNSLRRSGNSTRQINFAIEKLMQGYEVIVEDHSFNGKNKPANHYLLTRILKRLHFENNLENLIQKKAILIDEQNSIVKLIKNY